MKIKKMEMESFGSALDDFKLKYNFETNMKKNTFFKMWGNVVGKKFKEVSKPISINSKNILLIACKHSMVTNELFMLKEDILKKMQPFLKSLDIQVDDIVFNHKIWQDEKNISSQDVVSVPIAKSRKLTDDELQTVILDKETIDNIKKNLVTSDFVSSEQQTKMFNAIIKNLKVQKFKEKNNL